MLGACHSAVLHGCSQIAADGTRDRDLIIGDGQLVTSSILFAEVTSQNKLAQVFILRHRVQPVADVGGVDVDLAHFHVGGFET